MKSNLLKTACYAFVAAALVACPALALAADATNAPAAQPAPPKIHPLPFHGKVVAVDTHAMTFGIGSQTFVVTSATKITKAGKPAVFADITVGENVTGSYKKDDAGKLNTASVRIVENKKPDAATPAPQ